MIGETVIVPTARADLTVAARALSSDDFVFTWDGERVTYGNVRVTPAGRQEVVVVGLDDGSKLSLTYGSRLLLRDGTAIEVERLAKDASLLPLYRRPDSFGYETYLEPGNWFRGGKVVVDRRKWRPTHRMAAEYLIGRRLDTDETVEHLNRNRLDNTPGNMVIRHIPRAGMRSTSFGKLLSEAEQLVSMNPSAKPPRRPPGRNHKVTFVERGHCFAKGSRVYVIENSVVTPVLIEQLAIDGIGKNILGYDERRKIIRATSVQNVWLTKPVAAVVKIPLSNGATLRTTPDHKVMVVDRGYVEAKDLKGGDLLVGLAQGYELKRQSFLTQHSPGTAWTLRDPRPDTTTKVYDVQTETGNLIVDGVVCHNSTYCLSITGPTSGNFSAGGVFVVSDRRE